MTRLPDVINQKINNAGAMALAKGDEMSEMKSIDGMSDLSKEVAKLSKFLTDHIEKFACAFAKETGLDPTKIKMVQQSLDNGFGYKVWFEPFPKESDIEFYRVQAEHARVRAEKAEAMVERLVEAGSNLAFRVKGGIVHIDKWDALVEEWEALKGGEG